LSFGKCCRARQNSTDSGTQERSSMKFASLHISLSGAMQAPVRSMQSKAYTARRCAVKRICQAFRNAGVESENVSGLPTIRARV
jgi:hypothetical protein